MWDQVSVLRSEEGLSLALHEVESMRQESGAAPGDDGAAVSMLKVAEGIIRSARLRRESRGAHYRSDYPRTDSQYDGNTVCRQVGDAVEAVFEKQTGNGER